MSKELVISANRHETRVAVVEDDQVVEVYHQRENEYSLAGSIHKGRVTRVLPGMQSAFVDIGLDRDAFLYVSDFFEDNEEYDKIVTSVEEKVLKLDRTPSQPAPVVAGPPRPAEAEPAEAEQAPSPAEAASRRNRLRRAGCRGGGGPAAPVSALSPAPVPERERRDDRDRRGRHSRRRRGKGGRGLPDSKFYSPGQRSPRKPLRFRESSRSQARPRLQRPQPRRRRSGRFPGAAGRIAGQAHCAADGEPEPPVGRARAGGSRAAEVPEDASGQRMLNRPPSRSPNWPKPCRTSRRNWTPKRRTGVRRRKNRNLPAAVAEAMPSPSRTGFDRSRLPKLWPRRPKPPRPPKTWT